MSRMQRWALVGAVVVVSAFLLGVVGGLTGTSPVQLAPVETQSPVPR